MNKAEELLTTGSRNEWAIRMSTAYSLLSIAKSLESLTSMAQEWIDPHPSVVVGEDLATALWPTVEPHWRLDTPG